MSKNFRILGLKIGEDCAQRYKKVLEGGKLYLFTDEYEESDNEHTLVRKPVEDKSTTSNLYNIKCANGKDVSIKVSAIVGPNGCGKSTLVEIIMRLLNNLSFHLGFSVVHEDICRIYGLSAILYYEINGKVYAVEQKKNCVGITIYSEEGVQNYPVSSRDIDNYYSAKQAENELFYTIIENYSLYAYNSKYFIGEADTPGVSWIDVLFKKNDGYQTPVVINPMRDNGNINVNKEMDLSRQRLLALYSIAKDDKERMVDEGITARGIAFSLEPFPKLFSKDIQDYFIQTYPIERSWNGLEKLVGTQEEKEGFLIAFSTFVDDILEDIYQRNSELWKWVENACLDISTDTGDLGRTFNQIEILCGKLITQKHCPRFEKLRSLFTTGVYKSVNITQLYRIYLIEYIWDELIQNGYIDGCLNGAIASKDSPMASAMLYLVHKMIAIMTTYKPFTDRAAATSFTFDMLLNRSASYMPTSNVSAEVDLILGTDNYTTLKFWQTVHYLNRGKDDYYNSEDYHLDNYEFDHFISFDSFRTENVSADDKVSTIFKKLLPPIFEGDIILNDGKQDFPLSSLSSGMTQRLNIVGSLIYHIRNLDYTVEDEYQLQYKNINVITEEVELYFHPEYQKGLIEYLRKQLSMLSMSNIDSINFIFVTHSPFILSDILKQNILCLQKGVAKNGVIQHTFGANVFDILNESFFLTKGAIGDFAQQHIHNVICDLKKFEQRDIADIDKSELYEKIMMIDEPIARKLLMDKYYYVFPNTDKEIKIKELEKQLRELKGENVEA